MPEAGSTVPGIFEEMGSPEEDNVSLGSRAIELITPNQFARPVPSHAQYPIVLDYRENVK